MKLLEKERQLKKEMEEWIIKMNVLTVIFPI